MKIAFDVGGMAAEMNRNPMTGRFTLNAGGRTWQLQSPYNPGTHFGFSVRRHWHLWINDHDVRIEAERPALLAGFREHTYRVFVDGKLITEQSAF